MCARSCSIFLTFLKYSSFSMNRPSTKGDVATRIFLLFFTKNGKFYIFWRVDGRICSQANAVLDDEDGKISFPGSGNEALFNNIILRSHDYPIYVFFL